MNEKVYYKTHSGENETQTKKFLDYEGVKYLWSKINMKDYPNNETLMAVINAIDETKMDNLETVIFSGEYTAQSGKINFPDLTYETIGKIGVLYDYRHKIIECNIIDSALEPGTGGVGFPIWEGERFSYYPYWFPDIGWNTTLEDDTDQYTFSVVSPLKDIYIPDTIARISDIAQSDWEQNDETARDYIKNRTHYDTTREYVFSEVVTKNRQIVFNDLKFDPDKFYIVTISNDTEERVINGNFNKYSSPMSGFEGWSIASKSLYPDKDFDLYAENNDLQLIQVCSTITMPATLSIYYSDGTIKQLDEKYIPDTIARTYQIPDVYVQSVNGQTGDVIIDIPKGFSGSWNDLENKPTTTKYQDELLISRTDVENKYYFNLPDKFHLSGEHTYKAYLKNRYNYGYITISGYESANMLSMDLIYKNSSNNILFTAHGDPSGKIYFTDLSDFNNETLIIYSGEELMDHIIPDTIARVSDIPIIQIITWEADD